MTNSRDSRRNRRAGRGNRDAYGMPQASNGSVVFPMEHAGNGDGATSSASLHVEAATKPVQAPSLAHALPSPARSGRAMLPNGAGFETFDGNGAQLSAPCGGPGMNDIFAGSPVAGQMAFQNGGRFDVSMSSNDGRMHAAHVVPPRRAPDPWELPNGIVDSSPQHGTTSNYRDQLRMSGQHALQRTLNRGILPSSPAAAGTGMQMSNHVGPGGEMLSQQATMDSHTMQMAASGMQGSPTHMVQWNAPMDPQFWMPQMGLKGCPQMPPMMPDNSTTMAQFSSMMPETCQQNFHMVSNMQSSVQDNLPLVPQAIQDNSPQNQQSQLMNILMPARASMDNEQIVAELQAAAQCEYED